MKVDVKNSKGATVDQVDLPEDIFDAPINKDLMHQALLRQLANARLGTHKTKSRGEVRGGGAKPWRQKGTGRARAGSRRSPIFAKGGKVHTPRPRSYNQDMPRKMRRAALRSALTVKAGDIIVLDASSVDSPKTKSAVEMLAALGANNGKTLVLTDNSNENLKKSVSNLEKANYLHAGYLNIRDLLNSDQIVMSLDALNVIQSYLGLEA